MIDLVISNTLTAVAFIVVVAVILMFIVAVIIEMNIEEEEDRIIVEKCRSCARRHNCDGFGYDYACKRYIRDESNKDKR